MTFELKDLVYLMLFAGSLVTIFTTFSNRVANVEKAVGLLKRVVFKESGELAFITTEVCNRREIDIQKAIDKSAQDVADMRNDIKEMSENILVIMVHLNIDAENIKKGVSNG